MSTFKLGQVLQRGDLFIRLQDTDGNPVNAYSIEYDIYYVDPIGPPPNTEVLIPPSPRTPVNPVIGEYYASLSVPMSATVGAYRIRWTFKESSVSPDVNIVQEFQVVATDTILETYSPAEKELIRTLRILLRDQCLAGEETVELDADGERFIVSLEELYEIIGDGS